MFAPQLGIALDYRAIEAGRDDFARALDAFAREGGRGANVTLPLKQDARRFAANVSDRARRCGSVNTLIRDGEGAGTATVPTASVSCAICAEHHASSRTADAACCSAPAARRARSRSRSPRPAPRGS